MGVLIVSQGARRGCSRNPAEITEIINWKTELSRYTTATVNRWLEWKNMWCALSVYHWPLEIHVNRNCQIFAHARKLQMARAPDSSAP